MQPKRTAPAPHRPIVEPGVDIRQLQTFVTIVESGRMTAAAKMLGVAQSTVSETLAALERVLGAPVILRGRHDGDARLTLAGDALLPHARAVLAAVGRAQLAVAAATTTARARVEIVANESVSTYLLPRALAELRGRWPNTRFSVSVGVCSAVRAGVVSGAFDLGLLLEPTAGGQGEPGGRAAARPQHGAERRPVATNIALVVFSKPMHPLAHRSATSSVRRADVTAYPLFTSDAAGEFHAMVRQFFGRDRISGPKLEAIGSVEGVKRAVAAGSAALGILPSYAVADELRLSTFGRVDLRPAPPRLQLNALLSTSRARHPAAEELLSAIQRVSAGEARHLLAHGT